MSAASVISYHGSEHNECPIGRRSMPAAVVVVVSGVRGPGMAKTIKPRLGVTPGVGRLSRYQAGTVDPFRGLE